MYECWHSWHKTNSFWISFHLTGSAHKISLCRLDNWGSGHAYVNLYIFSCMYINMEHLFKSLFGCQLWVVLYEMPRTYIASMSREQTNLLWQLLSRKSVGKRAKPSNQTSSNQHVAIVVARLLRSKWTTDTMEYGKITFHLFTPPPHRPLFALKINTNIPRTCGFSTVQL